MIFLDSILHLKNLLTFCLTLDYLFTFHQEFSITRNKHSSQFEFKIEKLKLKLIADKSYIILIVREKKNYAFVYRALIVI